MLKKSPNPISAHAKVSLYAALNGYIEVFSPTRHGMLGRSFSDRTPESWIEIARREADKTDEFSHYSIIIDSVINLVTDENFAKAREIVKDGMKLAQKELRYITS